MVEKHYTVPEVAKILGYAAQTIRKYIKEGRIQAFKLGPSRTAEYRILESEIRRLQFMGYEDNMKALKERFKEE